MESAEIVVYHCQLALLLRCHNPPTTLGNTSQYFSTGFRQQFIEFLLHNAVVAHGIGVAFQDLLCNLFFSVSTASTRDISQYMYLLQLVHNMICTTTLHVHNSQSQHFCGSSCRLVAAELEATLTCAIAVEGGYASTYTT